MIGTALCRKLKKHDLIVPPSFKMNIGNEKQVMSFIKYQPNLIIHLAGETDHEYAEINPVNCYYINTVATGFLTNLARELNVPIIYQSTASVFDGAKNEPYTPEDRPNPINHYNRSKYYGELMVRDYDKHIILRSGWMFGGGPGIDKKFVAKIIEKIRRGDKQISVCTDCVGSPTYTEDLAGAYEYVINNLIDKDFGTYHCVNKSVHGVSTFLFAPKLFPKLKKCLAITTLSLATKGDSKKLFAFQMMNTPFPLACSSISILY